MEQKNYKKSTECIKACLAINNRFANAWKAFGNLCYETNNANIALKYYNNAFKCDKNDI